MASGGYEFETCDEIGDNFKCIICTWILREPMNLPCPHTFCRRCLATWRETRNVKPFRCPTCKQIYEENQVHFNGSMDLIIRTSLKVFCKKYEDGCDWRGTIDSYDLHANRDCLYAEMECQNNGCNVVFIRNNQNNHLSNCPMRFVPCSYCDELIVYSTLEEHYQACPLMIIPCLNDGCNEKIQRQNLKSHLSRCAFQIIDCPFKDIGCNKKLKRNEMTEHEKNVNEHFHLMYQQYRDMKNESFSTRVHLNETIEQLNEMKRRLHENITELNKTRQRLDENVKELKETKQRLHETKNELQDTKRTLQENIAMLHDRIDRNIEKPNNQIKIDETKQKAEQDIKKQKKPMAFMTRRKVAQPPNEKLDELTLPPNERIEYLLDKLKYFEENVNDYEILFKELFDTMEKDKPYLIKNKCYVKCRLDVRWQKEKLRVNVVDERKKFDRLKTYLRTVHHNKNVRVRVNGGDYVFIDLLVEEKGWMGNNTTTFIIHPKLHKKEDVGGYLLGVYKNVYSEYLFDGCLLIQICRQ